MEHSNALYILIASGILLLSLFRAWLEKRRYAIRFFSFLGFFEIAVLALLIGTLIFFGCFQILLRNFFHRGILWAEPLMRHIVLWVGCLGGAYATSRIRHINIDVFSRLLSGRARAFRNFIVYFATAAAASYLGMAALKLVYDEKAYGERVFLGINTWVLQLVLPFAFFLITYRCLLNIFMRKEERPLEGGEKS